uniref:Coiled-coil domain-containing protein 22 homolog n=1 Tax=Panagrolaimus sp. JU765 TaxID=591449 RepID=A0AC34Q8V0_9BILA
MENVDSLVLSTLHKLGCEFGKNGTTTLIDLERDEIVEGIIKLLWIIDEKYKKELPDWKISPHAAKKFQSATLIADAVNNVGIKEKFGYQSILYPNVFDVRKIFMNLIEKLPEEKVWIEKELSPFERLTYVVGNSVDDDLETLWIPSFCRRLKMVHDGRYWNDCTDIEQVNFRSNRFTNHEIMDQRYRLCQTLNDKQDVFPSSAVTFPFSTFDLSNESKKPIISQKPIIKPKPKPRNNISIESKPVNDSNVDQKEFLASEIALVGSEVDVIKHEMMEFQYAMARLEDDIIWIKDAISNTDPQLLELLTTEADPLSFLKSELSTINDSITEAEDAFTKADQELDTEYYNLKIQKGLNGDEDSVKLKIEAVEKLMEEKSKALKETNRQSEILKKRVKEIVADNERAKCRKMISEIMQNIYSQQKEKLKIYNDNMNLVKEIEYLNGNLNRTYTVVEKWMTVDGLTGKLQRAYRIFIAIHERSMSVKRLIKENSSINREIEEISDEIEIQAQNVANMRLNELMADISQIKEENIALKQRET